MKKQFKVSSQVTAARIAALAVAGLGIMVALGGIVAAQVTAPSRINPNFVANIEHANFVVEGNGPVAEVSPDFTSDVELGGATRFPNSELIPLTLSPNATTTLQEVTIGSRFSKALTFTAGTATSSGGVLNLQNTGATRICRGLPEVHLTSQVEGAMVFSFGTSTSATGYSNAAPSLIASTTIATGSADLLWRVAMNQGSNFGVTTGATASGTQSWLWNAGEYIIGSLLSSGGPDNSSSTDYSTAAGRIYVNCHTL